MHRRITIAIAAMAGVLFGRAAEGGMPDGTGMLFGANHAFKFTAANGWILDNESGVQQGLHMIFYPKGFTWATSPVIAYGRSVAKTRSTRTIGDQVKTTLDDFHQQGSPKYQSEVGEQLKLRSGRVAQIYYFSGDRWGNYEAVGYIEEERSINFLVFNARNKEYFDRYIPDFKSILLTYSNVYSKDIADAAFSKLVEEAKALTRTKEGRDYEQKLMQQMAPSLANIMRDCTSHTSKEENTYFELVLCVKQSGQVVSIYARPSNALTSCVKGMVYPIIHPPHKFGTFVEHIEMRITD